MRLKKTHWRAIKAIIFFVSLWPLAQLVIDGVNDGLGANPVETMHLTLGRWALRFLCLTLALTPLRRLSGQRWPLRFRRMMGLFAFFYASLHLLVFLWLDIEFSWHYFRQEVTETPYLLLGLATYCLLLPLALTSSVNMQKRLGRYWKTVHKLIYPAAVLALLHYFMLVKSDLRQPLIYAAVIFILLVTRIQPKRNA
ncbi:sulfite oxidase heme-binding subunit YedZ [methane-oxidizing endosymbiont of Gigantopelta aegis]|uniref:sulfite oxidase heme-binding subunit YedZ n=1 Tax=methane-oxidizing endosymbiont of Gigantopelta aegis TaxID=2794938 RepID=UPI0018DD6730|nr:protein-methionine-sulfoxide reductase heme-binding subunit MsrQ [methane-oxidizing endosymbiont of Gigantopelta aegis]